MYEEQKEVKETQVGQDSPANAVLQLANVLHELSAEVLKRTKGKLAAYTMQMPEPNERSDTKAPELPPYFSEMLGALHAVKNNLDGILGAVNRAGL